MIDFFALVQNWNKKKNVCFYFNSNATDALEGVPFIIIFFVRLSVSIVGEPRQ